jgi:hypothetical protein
MSEFLSYFSANTQNVGGSTFVQLLNCGIFRVGLLLSIFSCFGSPQTATESTITRFDFWQFLR